MQEFAMCDRADKTMKKLIVGLVLAAFAVTSLQAGDTVKAAASCDAGSCCASDAKAAAAAKAAKMIKMAHAGAKGGQLLAMR
jgi:hypothetical protein